MNKKSNYKQKVNTSDIGKKNQSKRTNQLWTGGSLGKFLYGCGCQGREGWRESRLWWFRPGPNDQQQVCRPNSHTFISRPGAEFAYKWANEQKVDAGRATTCSFVMNRPISPGAMEVNVRLTRRTSLASSSWRSAVMECAFCSETRISDLLPATLPGVLSSSAVFASGTEAKQMRWSCWGIYTGSLDPGTTKNNYSEQKNETRFIGSF